MVVRSLALASGAFSGIVVGLVVSEILHRQMSTLESVLASPGGSFFRTPDRLPVVLGVLAGLAVLTVVVILGEMMLAARRNTPTRAPTHTVESNIDDRP